jgi:ribosomal protein S18 acetylase RimI-like enzyme
MLKKNQILKNLKLLKDAYIKIDGYPDDNYLESMILNAQAVGIAFNSNETVGVGRIIGDNVRYSFIVDLVIDKNHRQKGIGTKLVKALAKSVKTMRIQLMTDPTNPKLKDFYKKAGFKLDKGAWVFSWEK